MDDEQNKTEELFEMIYFGSPDTKVNLSFIKGEHVPYERKNWVDKRNNISIGNSLINKFSMRHLGKSYEHVYTIAVPAYEINYFSSDKDEESPKCGHLSRCLIKTKEKGDLVGYKSGQRSAIAKINGKYYRFKGCGNLEEGFTLREMGFPKGAFDVRGCQFNFTAVRELYMSDKISEVFQNHANKVANVPLALWIYTDDEAEYKELSIRNDFKKIEKVCSVYEIISEKRLGRHLFPGLEIILIEILKTFPSNEGYKELISELFPQERIFYRTQNEIKQIDEINCTYEYVPILELMQDEGDNISSLFSKYNIYSSLTSNGMLVNLFELIKLKSDHKIIHHINDTNIKTFLVKYMEKTNIFSLFNNQFNKSSEEIIKTKLDYLQAPIQSKSTTLLELFGLIYARTGYEAGKMKRIMQDNDINWGTYEDLKFRLHCNSHTDNFAICPKGKSEGKNLLAILDFDLAFFRGQFINIADEEDETKYGQQDNFLFDFYLNIERQHLEWEFAGMENVISLEHYANELDKDERMKFISRSFISLLRDISVIYFRKGYSLQSFDIEERYSLLYDDIYNLIDISLLVTHDFIG